VNNFFSCDRYKEPTQFEKGSNDFFFIDNDRGISGGTTLFDELVIHRFFYQPQQIQNSQQTDYYFGKLNYTHRLTN
jgi:hypothetical protein